MLSVVRRFAAHEPRGEQRRAAAVGVSGVMSGVPLHPMYARTGGVKSRPPRPAGAAGRASAGTAPTWRRTRTALRRRGSARCRGRGPRRGPRRRARWIRRPSRPCARAGARPARAGRSGAPDRSEGAGERELDDERSREDVGHRGSLRGPGRLGRPGRGWAGSVSRAPEGPRCAVIRAPPRGHDRPRTGGRPALLERGPAVSEPHGRRSTYVRL